MKFITKAKCNIKTDNGWRTLHKGDRIDLPDRFKSHPMLETELEKVIDKKIKEITGDLKDDGKLNYSNNIEKKSPGRKPRLKKEK